MISFYGGPAGQDFEIKWIFPTYYGVDGLLGDINKGWKSSIAVGEYVMVSYGEPSSDSFIANRDSDFAHAAQAGEEQKNYNSTLWRKGYDESTGGTGIVYVYISTFTGFTPRITASVKETLAPGSDAKAEVDTTKASYPDQVEIDLSIPGSWNFDKGIQDIVIADVGVKPEVVLKNIGTTGGDDWNGTTSEAYLGRFKFTLPVAQNLLGIGVQVDADGNAHPEYDILNVGEKPIAYIITENEADVQGYYIIESYDSDYNPIYKKDENGVEILYTPHINTPILRVKIPQAQNIEEEVEVTHATPSVDEDNITAWLDKTTDVNNPTLHITIPNAWQFMLADTVEVDPGVSPEVKMVRNNEGTHQVLTFTLPRTGKFYQAQTLPAVGDPYKNGDIVIVTSNNTIYELAAGAWVAKGTLLPTFKSATALPLDPYDGTTLTPVSPTVKLEPDTTDGTWSLIFGLPAAPKAEVLDTTILGPEEKATAAAEISSATHIGFKFGIPRGSKLYSGVSEPTDAAIGDYWLDSDSEEGVLYKLETTGWVESARLVGPTGPALNIVADIGIVGSIDDAKAALTANYSDATSEQLYVATVDDGSTEISYWFYRTQDDIDGGSTDWRYVQLTGAMTSFISTQYLTTDADNKAYSASYVNSLIEGLDTETGEKKTYSQAKIDELLKALDETLNTWGRFVDLPDLTTTT